MSQVNYNAITDYAGRTAVDVNTIMTAFQTQSTNVTAANVADEGLDESSLGTACLTDGRVSVTYNSGPANAPDNAGFLVPNTKYLLNIGAGPTSFSSTNSGVGWFVGQNIGVLRAVFGCYWRYIWPAAAGGMSPRITVTLQYRIDGAVGWTDVPVSSFPYQAMQDVWATPAAAQSSTTYWDQCMCYEFDIPYPADGAQHTIDEVRVVMETTAIPAAPGDFQANDVFLHLERYIKAVS